MRILLIHIVLMIASTAVHAQTSSAQSSPTRAKTINSRAQTVEQLELGRLRMGLWIGPQITSAQFVMRSDQANSETQIDALPAIAMGLELWPTENLGVFLSGAVGLGMEVDARRLKALFSEDEGADAVIDYNVHHIEAGTRYRWFLGPEVDALSLTVGAGLNGRFQSARDQFPSILLDRMLLGPLASVSTTLPILTGRGWLRLEGRLGAPFFVRETPTDSGDPQSFVEYGARFEASYGITGRWSVQFRADYAERGLVFEDEATRGFGTNDVTTEDTFISGGLFLRFCPKIE